jgi:hypothetical protein
MAVPVPVAMLNESVDMDTGTDTDIDTDYGPTDNGHGQWKTDKSVTTLAMDIPVVPKTLILLTDV